jgi:tRNA pseudouridine38-40 synthase
LLQKKYYYLVKLQFLGFRYHGWQKQPDKKTIELMLNKTLKYIFKDDPRQFKVLGAGRTDAMVSALDAGLELFITGVPLVNLDDFLKLFNENLPQDIRIISIEETDKEFNIIQHAKEKEYIYLFSYGSKNHPYAAPFILNCRDHLDVEKMKEAALLFKGTHNFKAFTTKSIHKTDFVRTIDSCFIESNTLLSANFFPEKSYALRVVGKGFMRYQIRMMMGALLDIGKGTMDLDYFKKALEATEDIKLTHVAPASGLHLNKLDFK